MLRHESGLRLELFERAGSRPGIQGVAPIEALATRGYGHFALAAPDIDPVFAAPLAAGRGPWPSEDRGGAGRRTVICIQ